MRQLLLAGDEDRFFNLRCFSFKKRGQAGSEGRRGTEGWLEISGNTWTYNLNNGHAAVQALDAGQALSDSFTFTVKDPAGNETVSETFAITVTPVDDETPLAGPGEAGEPVIMGEARALAEGDAAPAYKNVNGACR